MALPCPSTSSAFREHLPLAHRQTFPTSSSFSSPSAPQQLQQQHPLRKKRRIHRPLAQDESCLVDGPSPNSSPHDFDAQLQLLCQAGHLSSAMDVLLRLEEIPGCAPSKKTYWSLLKACQKQTASHHAITVCSHIGPRIFDPDNAVLAEFLVSVLVSCRAFEHAVHCFDALPQRTAFSWTALMSGYVEDGDPHQALRLYDLMLHDGTQPDAYTFVCLLKACALTADLEKGKAVHDHAWSNNLKSNVFIGSNLIDMYNQCGSLIDAEDVFGALPRRCVVTWTVMLSAYVDHGKPRRALQLYRQMYVECVATDERAFVIALQACCMLAKTEKAVVSPIHGFCKVMSLEIGQGLHADARRKGFKSNVYVHNSLLSMYGKCACLSTAENLFFHSSRNSLALWNTMLSAYVEHDQPKKALHLYALMLKEGLTPGERTFVSALQACSGYAEKEEAIFINDGLTKFRSLEIGQALHADAQMRAFHSNEYVISALLNMYGKCGSITEARIIFNGLTVQNIVSCNAMLSVYVGQAQCYEAMKLYEEMKIWGVNCDDITLISLLQVCGQTASINICRGVHMEIVIRGFDLRPLVAINLIYAFGKCASMVDAQTVFDTLPVSNIVPWNALISGYVLVCDWQKVLFYFEEMQHTGIRPDSETFLSLLKVCGNLGLVKEGRQYFECMNIQSSLIPTSEHYCCMIKLAALEGNFAEVRNMLSNMRMKPNISLWLCVLEASAKHGNLELGKWAFDHAVGLEPKEAETYLVLSKLYAEAGLMDMVYQIDLLRQRAGAKKQQEVTWIEHNEKLLRFIAGECQSPHNQSLSDYLHVLSIQLKAQGEFKYANDIINSVEADRESDWSICGHSQMLALAFGLLNGWRLIRMRKNTCICRDCHGVIKILSHMKQVEVIVIDENRCHQFCNGRCSCTDCF